MATTDDLLGFDEVWPRISAILTPLGTQRIPLMAADGRVLRSDGCAAWDLPRDDNSAMDGCAVRAADTTEAPVILGLATTTAYAGSRDRAVVTPGTAVSIGTGGVVPIGADAIVPKENLRRDGNAVEILVPAHADDHIRRRGEELSAGDVVITAGARLDPLAIAALAVAGINEVEVGRSPVVRVLTSGDEVVPVGTAPGRGQVVDCNGPFLGLMLRRLLGVDQTVAPVAPDRRGDLAAALDTALAGADVVIVTGGVSVGDRDLVKPVLEEDLDVERLIWRVAQKPGKPTYVGRRGATWVVGLPGNPAAVATMWFVLVRPLLLALQGAAEAFPERFPVALAEPLRPNRTRTSLRWCRLEPRPDGRTGAMPLERAGSHMLSDFAVADGLVLVPPGDADFAAGASLPAIRLAR